MTTIKVKILASDPGTWEGATALLSAHPDIAVLTPRSKLAPDVLFVNTTRVSEAVLHSLELASSHPSAGSPPRIVLVTEQIGPRQLARAIGAGLVCLLDRRRSGYDRIARTIVAAGMIPALATRAPANGRAPAPRTGR